MCLRILMNLNFYQAKFLANFPNIIESITTFFYVINQHLILMELNVLSIFKFCFGCTEGLFQRSEMNIYAVVVVNKKVQQEGFVQV